eukprot:TRINITY_DN3834_c0_g1_i1.p1 TRINITY_DN3834_c0_g1~~TRINITY_DN3834_c0_g1_i1.p1  ORF type:complete len:213 (-),score=17.10 TRINITY_DN3834_c0_g1_i1:51-689(-)
MYNLLSHTVTGKSIRKAIDERVSYDDIRKGVTPVQVREDLEHEFGTPLSNKEAEIKKMMIKKFVESLQSRMAQIVDERNWMLLNDYNTKEIKEIIIKEYTREEHKTFIESNGDLIKRLLIKIFLNRVAKAARSIIQEYSIVTGRLTGEQVQEELERKYLIPMDTYRNFLNLLCAHPNSQVDELIDLHSERKYRARRIERQEQEDSSSSCSIM